MLTEDVAEIERLKAEAAQTAANAAAREARKAADIKDRSDTAADLRSKLWNLDTSAGHRESKGLRDALKSIKDNPGSNYARTNFARRQAAAVMMIKRFRDERESKGAPAGEQIQNGVINFLGDLTSGNFFKSKKAKGTIPQKGELPAEIVDLKGKDTQELLKAFKHGVDKTEQPTGLPESGQGKRRVRRGKSLYERARDYLRERAKKKGKPERPTFDGRPWEHEDHEDRDINEL